MDEIPRAQVVRSFEGKIAALELDFFYYKLNCKNLTMKWPGPALVRRSQLKSPQDARERARRYWEYGTPVLSKAGWHFSYMQNPADIKLKLESFSHQECNTREFTDVEAIAHRIKYGLDLLGRTDHFWCCVPLDATFPAYLLEHPERFRDFIGDFNEFHVNRQFLISRLYERLGNGNEDLAFLSPSANVLLEREGQIRALLNEVASKQNSLAQLQNRVAQLQAEFDDKALWADRLNVDLAGAQSRLTRLQAEFDEKALWADPLNAEVSKLRAHVQQSQDQQKLLEQEVQTQRSRIQELSISWSQTTRWKRALVFFTLAPLDWAVGCAVLAAEIASRLLRKMGRRKARLVAPADTSRCSIIVLSWEGKDLLAESLPPLLKAVRFHGGNHEVIVLDNGSTDGTSEYVADHFPEVRVVRSERNLFFGGGNNLGVRAAKNDIVILLNNDMFVHEDFLGSLLEGFRGPEVFAVASQVFLADPDKRREETGKTRATFNGCDLDWAHAAILPSDEERKYVPVFWGHGGAVALDRQKFVWLGGLDTLFHPFYLEDADLSYRAWRVGWRCLLAVESHVVHKHRGTAALHFSPRFINQIIRRNQYLFIWKNIGNLRTLVKHFLRSPRRQIQRAGIPGVGIRLEAKAFLGAVERLPAVLKRKLSLARSAVRSDEEILQLISTPPAEAIRESEVDFGRGDYGEQLGEGWYPREQADGKSFRWMSKAAEVFLRAPAETAELCICGYVSISRRSGLTPLVLSVNCQGERRRFRLREGSFEGRWTLARLSPGAPVSVQLAVNHVLTTLLDPRTLGIIVRSVALSTRVLAKGSGHLQIPHPHVSVSRPSPPGPEVSGQPNVLMVCAYLPCLGVHGGGNTMFNLIRLLSKRHRLTVLSFYERESDLEHIPMLTPYCEQLEVIFRGQTLDAPNPFGLKPPEIVYDFYHQGMHRLVEHYLRTHEFDLMQCEYLQTAHYASIDPAVPAVLSNIEVLSLAYSNRYKHLPWISVQKFNALVSWMRMLNYEEKMLRRFSGIVVPTRPEREFLARYVPQVPVSTFSS